MPGIFSHKSPAKATPFHVTPPENDFQIHTKTPNQTPLRTVPLRDSSSSAETGSFLLKLARDAVASGDDVTKALDYASRASVSFERSPGSELELAMSLHVVAAIYCSLGRYEEAVPVLQRSVEVAGRVNGSEHGLAKLSGYMQLGDTYAMLGQLDRSISCYESGLRIQIEALGDRDPRIADTCRYLAEAYIQAMHFDEAEKLCKKSLEIQREYGAPASLEEAADRRLMGLICEAKGDYESALEHLVLASMVMIAKGQENEVAVIDVSIGNIYLSLCRFEEAIFSYQKALTVFKSANGDNHTAVASVFIRLADLYCKTGKLRESKSYCENALRIYSRPIAGTLAEEIACGLTEISVIYEALNETGEALRLLHKAMKLLENTPGQHSKLAGIEAQMGVMFYMVGRYGEARSSFASAVAKLRACGETTSAFFGILLNQMGLASVQLYKIDEAAEFFEEARRILEQECGPCHLETLGVYSNLAATYDALGRVGDAIEILEYILKVREEKLGTANPDVDDEKKRLAELLNEAGRSRIRKGKSLENLLGSNREKVNKKYGVNKWSGFSFRT